MSLGNHSKTLLTEAVATSSRAATHRPLASACLVHFSGGWKAGPCPPPRGQNLSRAGVRAWQDPELLRRLNEISPEGQLEDVIWQGGLAIPTGGRDWKTAAEVRKLLMDSAHRDHARELLKNTKSAGRYLRSGQR